MSPGNISDISSLFFPPRPFQKPPPPSSLSAPACQTGHIFLSFTPLPLNSNKCHNYGCAALLTSAGKQAAPGPSLSGVMRNAVCASGSECAIFFFFFALCRRCSFRLMLMPHTRWMRTCAIFFCCFKLAGHQRPASVNHEATQKKKKNDEEKNLPPAST